MERVLVCVIGQTRSHQLTWAKFKKHVLDELQADLALAIGVDQDYDYANPMWQHARYKWPTQEFDDYGDAFDLAQRWLCAAANIEPPEWRGLLKVKHYWLGGIRGDEAHAGGAAIPIFFRWWLRHNLIRDDIVRKYDRIIITRSDFMWDVPHPPMAVLRRDQLWLPDGEFYWGLTDRHMIVSTEDVLAATNVMEDILLRPRQLAAEMSIHSRWNMETFLDFQYEKAGLRRKVKVFPYVMYAVRDEQDATRGAHGQFVEAAGCFVKYPLEYQDAQRYAAVIRTSADWGILARAAPDLFHEVAMSADLLTSVRFAPRRVLTFHETVLYFDPSTGTLHHNSLWTCPANLALLVFDEHAHLLHIAADGRQHIVQVTSTDDEAEAEHSGWPAIAQRFEIIADPAASWLGFSLKCDGYFLRAQEDGRIVLSRRHDSCARFKAVGKSQWKALSWPISADANAAVLDTTS